MNPSQTPGYDWLATGGAYWIIALSWFLSAAFFSFVGMRAAKGAGSENDGCLLIICSILLALTGGGSGLYLGLFFTHYPTFVLTSILGAVALPGLGTLYLVPRVTRHR
ncbi:hypothetical protein [Fimbriimonas ginsengisoli]|uniref:Uncharacterized protein n=1 Tax=Fimbriimonas ginsengisoli Gsoil 348 TaxID=661478 RepID=A0A068NSX4_FIMGI|nr:hypothetical protein [Fimbriimonas ginsengisoli]AIE86452.1 hypothetical protein OP10G_3084 [Fimbriimonas ginsengisoli Gsoil 348]